MRQIARAAATLALFVIVATAVAACGSSSSSSTSAAPATTSASGTSTAASGTSTAASGTPIKLGFICSCSGALAATYGESETGIQVWAKSVNGSGGISGHPVKVFVLDDAANPATALQDAKQLVESDKVMAIVGETSVVDAAFSNYIESVKVPVVGGQASDAPFASNPYFFSTGSGLNGVTFGMVEQLKQAGATKVGETYCAEAPVCAQFSAVSQAAAKVLGLTYVSYKVAATTPSFTSQCLALKSAGVNGFIPALDAVTATRVVDACVALGYKPHLSNAGGSIGVAMFKDANMAGDLVLNPQGTFNDPAYPGAKEMLDAFAKYDPSVPTSPEFNYTVQAAWLGGKLFEAASQAAGGFSPTSTPADVIKGLYAIKGNTLGGLAPPLSYKPGKPTVSECYFVQAIQAGKLVTKIKAPVCPTAQQDAALSSALGSA